MNTKLKSPRISRTTARANIWNYDAALVHRDVTGAFVLGRVGAAGQGHRRYVIRRANAGAINDWNVAGHDAAEVFKSGEKTSTVVPLTALYPLVTILLAVPLLKEKLNRIQLIGVVLALAAIYL